MTIGSETRKAGPFDGNDSTTDFAFAFKVFAESDLQVVTATAGVETVQALTTNYTVSLNADQNTSPGGTVTMLSAPATGSTLTITSDVPNTQPVNLVNLGGFYPTVINDALDRATIQIQQLENANDRSIKIPLSSEGTVSTSLPLPVSNKYLRWNTDGTGIVNADISALDPSGYFLTDSGAPNGIVTGSAGSLFLSTDGAGYIKTSGAGNTGWEQLITYNPVTGETSTTYNQGSTGAVTRTLDDKLQDYVSVKDFGAKGDGVTDDTNAIRAAFDAMLSVLTSGGTGVTVFFPDGVYIVTDELMSDSFQQAWWSQTNLRKGKFFTVEGSSSGGTTIVISPSYVSSVRNTANGNQRTYGPFANEPSPSCLFPLFADKTSGPAASFNIKNLRLQGSDTPSVDPVAIFSMNELDASIENLHIVLFANYGHVIMGSFNSVHLRNHYEGCGLQPIESGSILGWTPGLPIQQNVKFDYNSTTNTVTAKAKVAFDTYAIDDLVPYFYTSHVGKEFAIQSGANSGGIVIPLRGTIASVSGDGVSAATITVPAGLTDATASGVAASFYPVKATTNGSATITLSAPIKWGSGAADMVGHLIAVPKAGSVADTNRDLFCSRIMSCDVGNDTDGYTQVTVAAACNASVTEDFICGATQALVTEEDLISGALANNVNDTDFIGCRLEHSSGYSAIDQTTSSYCLLTSSCGEAVQYVSCKIHGAPASRGSFASDGQIIADANIGLFFIGCSITHHAYRNDGAVRFTGASNVTRFVGCDIGGFFAVHDYVPFFFDPQTGYDPDNWSVLETDTYIKVRNFASGEQSFFGHRAGLNVISRLALMSDETNTKRTGAVTTMLTSNEDLDELFIVGNYAWTTSAPANAPGYPNYSTLSVTGGQGLYTQTMHDLDNDYILVRDYFSSAWGHWRMLNLTTNTATGIGDNASAANTIGKHLGKFVFNTTDSKLYVAQGPSSTDTWISADGATTITPSAGP